MMSPLSRSRDRCRANGWRSLLASAAWVLLARAALAEGQVELTWDAPRDCPRDSAVWQRLRSLAGESLQRAGRLHAEGRIVRSDGRYRLTLTVHDGGVSRDRTIDADSCADLAGAAAVTLVLLLRSEPEPSEPDAATSAESSGAEPRATAEDTANKTRSAHARPPPDTSRDGAPPRPASQPDASASAPSKRRWRAFVGVPLVAADFGRLPDHSLGGGVRMGVCYDAWCISAVGRIFSTETLSLDFPDVGAELTRATAEIWTCHGWRTNGFGLAPCLTAGLDSITARGVGPDVSARSARATSLVLGGGLVTHWYLADWVAVAGAVGAGIETSRPHVIIDGFDEVLQLGLVHVGVALGSEWIFDGP